MFYDLDQVRAHYRQLLKRKPADFYERFDQHLLDKRPLVRKLIGGTFDRLFPEKVETLLDVGCGTCFYFPLLARHAESLIGVDICIPMLDQALELIDEKGLANCHVRESSAMDLPFEDGSVDVVHSWDFLHHVPDVSKAAAEIARVLKPGGRYVALEPNLINPSIAWYHLRRRAEWRLFLQNQFSVPRMLRHRLLVEISYDNTIISFLSPRTWRLWKTIDSITAYRPLHMLSFRYVLECRKKGVLDP